MLRLRHSEPSSDLTESLFMCPGWVSSHLTPRLYSEVQTPYHSLHTQGQKRAEPHWASSWLAKPGQRKADSRTFLPWFSQGPSQDKQREGGPEACLVLREAGPAPVWLEPLGSGNARPEPVSAHRRTQQRLLAIQVTRGKGRVTGEGRGGWNPKDGFS